MTSLWKICKRITQLSPFDHATWQHPRENPRHVRGSARIYDVRMAIEKLSHIIGARRFQDLRSPSPIMAPDRILHFSSFFELHGSIFIFCMLLFPVIFLLFKLFSAFLRKSWNPRWRETKMAEVVTSCDVKWGRNEENTDHVVEQVKEYLAENVKRFWNVL